MKLAIILAATFAASAAVAAPSGEAVFKQRCAVCHMPEGQGVPGAFPALRKDVKGFATKPDGRRYLVLVVTRGLAGPIKADGQVYRGIMPPQSMLTDAQVAAVLNHIATPPAPFTAEEVTKIKTEGGSVLQENEEIFLEFSPHAAHIFDPADGMRLN